VTLLTDTLCGCGILQLQLSFVVGVYPSLILTYLGQASWLMHNLDGYSAVFYNSLPKPVFWPIFVVSVLASIVASQVTAMPTSRL
jgi:KUP system potassium uptake protein